MELCHMHMNIKVLCIFPKLALANGVLTVLLESPWLVRGNAANAARHLCG